METVFAAVLAFFLIGPGTAMVLGGLVLAHAVVTAALVPARKRREAGYGVC